MASTTSLTRPARSFSSLAVVIGTMAASMLSTVSSSLHVVTAVATTAVATGAPGTHADEEENGQGSRNVEMRIIGTLFVRARVAWSLGLAADSDCLAPRAQRGISSRLRPDSEAERVSDRVEKDSEAHLPVGAGHTASTPRQRPEALRPWTVANAPARTTGLGHRRNVPVETASHQLERSLRAMARGDDDRQRALPLGPPIGRMRDGRQQCRRHALRAGCRTSVHASTRFTAR